MPDLPAGDLIWVACVAIVAGLVRGFSGFGTALIYVPLASLSLPPIWVLVTLTLMDLVGPLPNVPRALRDGRPREVGLLAGAAALALVPALFVLGHLGDAGFRWMVSGLCLVTVILMASGWRWSGRMTSPRVAAIGGMAGFLGGVAGLPGPPVILAYMAAPLPAAVVRANIMLFLVLWDVIFGAALWASGRLTAEPVWLGIALIVPYLLANMVGAKLFRPDRERMYRIAAYSLIAAAAVAAVPLW
ncbi:sulfite exporter TauE/SafE family protein [Jannaschia pohangensis]|uniref:Probable membrane transporter protein n=1 Tax=Jannaschia pohangensis TaxID=390807 RepID=A0A1I3N9Z7_9RHOB|nr:sulfite exporter TauE/SafE family protein [Jannaschia pohangensis]SFJ05999.1 hypothetical protein SAMN04488095_2093 [Jannaschia pohangensis]